MVNRKIKALTVKIENTVEYKVYLPLDVDTVELFSQLSVFYTEQNAVFPISRIIQYFPTYKENQ